MGYKDKAVVKLKKLQTGCSISGTTLILKFHTPKNVPHRANRLYCCLRIKPCDFR